MMKNLIFLFLAIFALASCEKNSGDGECSIRDLVVEVDECTSDSTYRIVVDFLYENPDNDNFDVFVRGNELLGSYLLSDLPITISDFSLSGKNEDFLKVCISDNPDCCMEIEWVPPSCGSSGDCTIREVEVIVGDCTSDSTYNLELDFVVDNPGVDTFELYVRNNQLIGVYSLSDLPLSLTDFEMSGNDDDFFKICIKNSSDCCRENEWKSPECEEEGECEIRDLAIEVGDCTSDSTYTITIDFIHENAGNDYFDVYVRNNQLIGTYLLSDLPLTLSDFELSGRDYDFLKVCINDVSDCCKEIEWMPPECEEENECEIRDLAIEVGDCTSDSTYTITIDFIHENAGNDYFDVYVRNNQLIGTYLLSDLPLTLPDFELSGRNEDFLKVCINDQPDCCVVTEWESPEC